MRTKWFFFVSALLSHQMEQRIKLETVLGQAREGLERLHSDIHKLQMLADRRHMARVKHHQDVGALKENKQLASKQATSDQNDI